jgi:hypothetical protein
MEDDDFDFGFTTIHADDLPHDKEAELTAALQKLYNSILPLLQNLKSQPEKDYIMWPDRTTKITAFKKKIDNIVKDFIEKKPI